MRCGTGTGKTHTVRGILNVWHIVHYNRFLESLVKALARCVANIPVSCGINLLHCRQIIALARERGVYNFWPALLG